MSDKKYTVRSKKDFGEKTGLDRTKINNIVENDLASGEEFAEDAKRFEDDSPVPTL